MDKNNGALKSLLAAGAATAFAGAALYAVGQTLSFLFRDVDPDRIEKNEADGPDAIAAEDAAEADEVSEAGAAAETE